MSGKYDDILHLPYPRPTKFPRMSAVDRAAQFSPFAALTGYEETIQETGRLTASPLELHEDARVDLDRKQQLLLEMRNGHPEVSVCYFLPDERKAGGAYVCVTGTLRSIDPISRILQMENGTQIPLDAITELDSPLFSSAYLLGQDWQ